MTKIMLVEDDNNLREIYGARLMAEGYQIVSAADGEEALALAVKEKPELIVADVMMPKISGFDMLDILRTTPETKNTKVIIMTALSQPEDRARGESLGADKYLVKSQVTLEDVVAAVHEILGDGPGGSSAGGPVNETMPTGAPPAPAQPPAQTSNASQQPPPTAGNPPAGQPDQNQTLPEDQPPKVEGASDAPEPASRKKKVIKPINDLNHEKEDFLKMVAEEEANEKQSTPGASVGPTDDAAQQQANMAQSAAEEKKQMDDEVNKMVNDGTIDNEATAPPVQPSESQSGGQGSGDGPGPGVDMSATAPPSSGQPPAPSQSSQPAATDQADQPDQPQPPAQPEQPASPQPSAPVPPAEPATPTAPEADPSSSDVPQPGSSVSPQTASGSQAGGDNPDNQQAPQPPAGQDKQPETPAENTPKPPTNEEDNDQSGQNPQDVAL